MRYELTFEDNPKLTDSENATGRECIDDFNDMFNVTCNIFSTFKGESGQKIVETVISLVKATPELRQFMFEFYYNTRSAERVCHIYNEE